MRNLLEYPITKDEVCDVIIKAYQAEYAEMRCGDLGPFILDRLLTVVKRDFNPKDYAIGE
jgi:hypothetical protein